MFDEPVSRVAELIERMEHLDISEKEVHVSSPIMTAALNPSGTLVKQLKYIEQQKEEIAIAMQSPPSGTEEHWKLLLQDCQKDIGEVKAQLSGIMGEILALPDEDAALLDNAISIKRALSELNFETGQ